jgi:hypothetical protein
MFKRIITTTALFIAIPAFAGDCVLSITRDACPGKEDAAFKPYGGKQTTEEKKSAGSEGECKTHGEKAAKILRKGTLSGKKVVATFDGKAAGEFSDKAECK